MATEPDRINNGVVATIVGVGTFAMISISAMVTAMVRDDTSALDLSRPVHADLDTVAALDKQQLATLSASPHWVDKAKGTVAIPIEVAMSLVLAEYQKDPKAASPPPPPGLIMDPAAAAAGSAPGSPPVAGGTTPAGAAPVGGAPAQTATPSAAVSPVQHTPPGTPGSPP
jgi:hypothetical protein